MTSTTLILALILIFCVYAIQFLLKRVFSVLDNIPGPPRSSILTGNLTQFYHPDGSAFQQHLEEDYGQVVKIHGLLGDRQLFVFDPVALQSVLEDQEVYEEMEQFILMNRLLFGNGILSTPHRENRRYRKLMMPAFSTANLRGMSPVFYEVARKMRDGLVAPNVSKGPKTLDFTPILRRTSLELIGLTGIGYSFDPMLPGQEETDRYAQALRALIPTTFKLQLGIPLLPFLVHTFPPPILRWMTNVVPLPTLHKLRDLVDFTYGTAAELVRERKAALEDETETRDDRKDIMSLLIKANSNAESGTHLTDDELVAATSMIIFAATDTTASSLNRMVYLFAEHPEVQERLRAEILSTSVSDSEELEYDALEALPYLDGVIREILRLYPPVVPGVYRQTTRPTLLPLSTPLTSVSGAPMHALPIPKGTAICVAIAAANHNKAVWGEDAREFRPERWVGGKARLVGEEGEGKTKMGGVYGNTMTFTGGGRSCIGFKFATLEMKVIACVLLRAFKFSAPDPGVDVQWRHTGTMLTPHVDGQPGLPIRVERLDA